MVDKKKLILNCNLIKFKLKLSNIWTKTNQLNYSLQVYSINSILSVVYLMILSPLILLYRALNKVAEEATEKGDLRRPEAG